MSESTKTFATNIDVIEFLDMFGYTKDDHVVSAILVASAEDEVVALQVTTLVTKSQMQALKLLNTPMTGASQ